MFYPSVYDVPYDVEPYVMEYRKQAELHGAYVDVSNLEINFTDFLPDNKPASARFQHETILVVINRDIWNSYESDTTKREAVIFHELSHKALNRRHVPDDSLSLMQESPDLRMYKYQRDYLLNELFSTSSQ
jgi:hypothetical protein